MARHGDVHKAELVDHILEVARHRLGAERAEPLEGFLRGYFADVPLHDIHAESPETLFGAALCHWRLGKLRTPGRPIVRAYNPRLDEHGWHAEHTVVETVTDDMPFLVDSITAELNRRGLTVHLTMHPMYAVERDADGTIRRATLPEAADADAARESYMHVQVTQQSADALAEIAAGVEAVLDDVRAAVEDWRPMRERLAESIDTLATDGDADGAEARAFLEWVHNDHFTLLGFREYAFDETDGETTVSVDADAGLGLLRDAERLIFHELRHVGSMPAPVRDFVSRPDVLMVTKSNHLSTVHRPVLMDSLGIKRFDAKGRVVGLGLFTGLFTSVAYSRTPRDIPLLRRKLENTLARAGFAPRGHNAKALQHILETYPRDELFQVSEDDLLATSLGILHLQERQRVALFLRQDDFERFISCLVFVPRDRYTTALRVRIQAILERTFAGGVSAHYSQLGDSPLARLHIIVRTTPGEIPAFDAQALEDEIVAAARLWSDHLCEALIQAHGEEQGQKLFHRYSGAFPPGYEERFSAEEAVADVDALDRALTTGEIGMALYRPFDADENQMRFKVFHPDAPIHLSHMLPMLEHLGLRVIDEVPHAVRAAVGGQRLMMIHDFGVQSEDGAAIDIGAVRDNFLDAFAAVWRGEVESDRFNSLVLRAGLAPRQVVVVRACCKYLRQAGIAFSQAYMEQTLARNAGLARLIVTLFEARFDPAGGDAAKARAELVREEIATALDAVESADEDRILRRFVNVVEATLRTNYFQRATDGGPKPYVSFKLSSGDLDELPLPRPWVETFVYSPRVEAIHLRGGRVARGGIRWSDRPEDFRTEVLGLMKAQMVKNAVIVPVGAKGGFVVKRPPPAADRDAFQAEGVECYKTLMRGLLDLADNLVAGEIVPPAEVVRHDEDDPYLVVAADKGTATFSDIANGVSAEYGFWLGDAFASGGSQGYDHKGMGITARGAWESVKRHFREIGVDTQAEDFTVVGVGDMSGDVFGNGMLLSEHIRLVAAFNHLHVFVDPDPDAEASFAERQRLFALPRSSWSDYDAALISPGGAVFDRRAKSIRLTPEIKRRFGLAADVTTPNELIRALLRAEVDLLWFGGIGTYVKATDETHVEAGDRANDAVRVDAAALRCKVVGEGANLGLTQPGRAEFAGAGGRLNTDFIDNSAGVDCSDHEVNIKILLGAAVADGDLTEKQRNSLLTEMTDEVGQLVLRNNYLQTQAISLIAENAAERLDTQTRLMRMLERQGRLDRAVEFMPDDEALAERAAAGKGLTRPEISVLFSRAKMWLYDEVLPSDLPDDRYLAEDAVRYFPSALHDAYKERIAGHRLKRELVATLITNSLINRVGGTFVTEIAEKTGMAAVDITRAYIVSRDVFAVRDIWEAIEALDNEVPAALQTELHREVQRLLERATLWFLRSGGSPVRINENISGFRPGVSALAQRIEQVLPEAVNERIRFRADRYGKADVPAELAQRVAYLVVMVSALDIVRIAAAQGITADDVARLYFAVGDDLGFGWLRYQAEKVAPDSYWQKLAVAALIEELYAHQRDIVVRVLDVAGTATDGAFDTWTGTCTGAVARARALMGELESAAPLDLSMLTVASRQLGALADA